MATIASLNVALSADSAKLKRDLDRAGKTTQTWANKQKARFKGVASGARGLQNALVGMAAVMGTGKLLDNADALGKNAAAAGLSVEAYQRLKHGFAEAGISQSGFEKGQKTLNKIFADAGDGMSTAVDALAAVGLSYEELAAMDPGERMLAVAKGLESIEDAGLRSAAAAELMGKEMGTVTLDADQIVKDGEGIAVISEETALKAAEMNDAMARMSTTIQSLVTEAVIPLVGALAPVLESIAQFAQDNPMMASVIAGVTALGVALTVAGGPLTLLVASITGAILIFQNWDEIVGYLSDKWEEFGEAFPGIASAIEVALDALAAPFRIVKDVVSAIFELFSGEGSFLSRLGDFAKNIVETLVANNPVVKLMENLAGVIKVPLNAVIAVFENMVNNVIDSINDLTNFSIDIPLYGVLDVKGTSLKHLDLPAFATGGYVSGAGTGTSDSIPAMLSNGEYVINANSTSKFGPLLEAINSGNVGAFATGGPVGSSGPVVSGKSTKGTIVPVVVTNPDDIGADGDGGAGEKKSWAQGIADDFSGTLKSELSKAISTGDWSSIGETLMDTLTMTIIDSTISSGVDFLMGALGFADGGIVPTTPNSKSYADSVPAMLQPGELVVPVDQVDSFMSGAAGGGRGQTFNINVTGDVSRLTRSEIVKMMPEIAAGTNMLNKENGRR